MQEAPLFIVDKNELGLMSGPPANIKVEDPQPSRGIMYQYPEQARDIISSMLSDMEDQECKRMCLDYRHVKKHLTTDINLLPRLAELIVQAANHKYCVTLDMKDAYIQILLDPKNRDLTTFNDGVSLCKFRRLPFGLNYSLAIFSRCMAAILAPLLKEGWLRNYLDDLILWESDFDVLLERVKRLFTLLIEYGLKLNLSKCTFGLKEVNFLGHIISEKRSRPNPKNLGAVIKMKLPTTVKEVRRFLGMVSLYRKHVPSFVKIASPLSILTRTDVTFAWTPQYQKTFKHLRECLVNALILV